MEPQGREMRVGNDSEPSTLERSPHRICRLARRAIRLEAGSQALRGQIAERLA